MKYVLLVAALLGTPCCASPTTPSAALSAPTELRYPTEFQPVINALDADPWIHPLIGEPMGGWVRRHVREVRFDATLAPQFVAFAHPGNAGLISWRAADAAAFGGSDVALSVAYLLHEVRHLQGYAHTCGNFDQTMTEGGAYAVQILYLEHAGYPAVANAMRASSICRH